MVMVVVIVAIVIAAAVREYVICYNNLVQYGII